MKKQLLFFVLLFAVLFGSAQEFITTWKTDNPGTSNSTSITIPTFAGETYSYDVDWNNDGNYDIVDLGISGSITHDFGAPGTYTIRIRGTFPRIFFNNSGDKEKLLAIEQWGNINWSSMENAFFGATNLAGNANDTPNLSGVTSLRRMFSNATLFNQNISNWDVSTITDFSIMLGAASSFNQDIGGWNVALGTNFSGMFFGATSFNQDISSWTTNNATNMSNMFNGATVFNQNLGSWNVENVSSFQLMFDGITLSVSNYDALLMGWNAQNLQPNMVFNGGNSIYCNGSSARTNMISSDGWTITDGGQNCTGVLFITTWQTTAANESIEIPTTGSGYSYDVDWESDGTFDDFGVTGNITHVYPTAGTHTVSIRGSFPRFYTLGSSLFSNIAKLMSVEQWGTTSWISMEFAFSNAENLVINATDAPDLSLVANMNSMFENCSSLNQNIGFWDTTTITNMGSLFEGAITFNQDISTWNVINVTIMTEMFQNAFQFNQDLSSWNTVNVTNMESLFFSTSFNQNIDSWNTSSVISMAGMFGDTPFNQDLSSWITTDVTDMTGMFFNASSFNQDLSNWDVSKVATMSGMFFGASSFNQSIGWSDIGMVTDMSNMFNLATAFNQDINNLDFSNVANMEGMFANASAFNQDISSWNTSSVINMSAMFVNATAFDQNLGGWNVENVASFSSMFANVTLSQANYDALLIGWDAQNLQPNATFSGGNSQYCSTAAIVARANMIASDGWTITDGGQFTGTCTLGVNDFELNRISLYPNPSNSHFAIKGLTERSNVAIYNITGKKVYENGNYTNEEDIKIDQLNSGLYIVTIKNNLGSTNIKLVRN